MNTKLKELMNQHHFTEDTVLYRYTLPEFLTPGEPGKYQLSANPNATEIVEDYYKSGHSIPGHDIGPGLSFFVQKEPEYALPEKKCVKVKLGDIIAQGGLIYPDYSTFSEGCFFLTMPSGSVEVELDA